VTKRFALAALLVAFASPLYADFNAIARTIDGYRGVKRVWTPGIGLARFFVRVVAPAGVHDFQVAVFEGADDLDPRELHSMLRSKIEPGFVPLVQVRSQKSGEWNFIYVRPRANSERFEMMLLTHDNDDTVLIRVDVDAEVLARELDHPRNVHRVARR
jgi:hypothetical protein